MSIYSDCSDLTEISIPEGVTSIGEKAFSDCKSLNNIYSYASTPAKLDATIFSEETYNKATLHVPYGTIDNYKTSDYWKNFSNIVEFDPTSVDTVIYGRKPAEEQKIYNLGGMRLATPLRGLNIINGNKVMY